MDGPITRTRSMRFQEEFGKRLNFLRKKREEEAKLKNFNRFSLEYDLFSFLIVFWPQFLQDGYFHTST